MSMPSSAARSPPDLSMVLSPPLRPISWYPSVPICSFLMDNRCETSDVNPNKEDENHVRDDNEDEFAEPTPEQQSKLFGFSAEDIKGMIFPSEPAAYNFYNAYAKVHGFSVRKDDIVRDEDGLASCNMLCKIAAKKPEHFKLVKDEIWKLSQMLDKQGDQHTPRGASVDDVGDPDVIKSKGAPKKKSSNRKFRKCSICNTVGHNRTTCPKRACAEDQPACNDHPSSSFGDSSEYDHDVEGMSSDESLWKDNEPTSTTEPQVNDTLGSMSVSNKSLSKVNEPMSSTQERVKDSRGSMPISNESLSKVNKPMSSTQGGVKDSMKRKRSINGGSISTDMKSDSVTHFSNTKMKSTGPIGVAKKDPTVGVSLLTPKQNLYPYGIAPPYGIRPPYGIAPPYGIRPPYGIAPSWQGMPLYPYGLAPLHPQFPRVSVPNQIPQLNFDIDSSYNSFLAAISNPGT
ncbi:hypothetical protein RIF29_24738 [Crotalaria pallida]|uniref:Uncharacterized protein n=1 Tax=Crotalaria pallida TaxID=3830 RepID=A0AAN9EKB9_CROPI